MRYSGHSHSSPRSAAYLSRGVPGCLAMTAQSDLQPISVVSRSVAQRFTLFTLPLGRLASCDGIRHGYDSPRMMVVYLLYRMAFQFV